MRRAARTWLPHATVLAVVTAAYAAGVLAPAERLLMDLRFRLLDRGLTGDVVVVQIDARSLHELEVWPWPRTYHARLIDRLIAAGASEIAFDVDLSGRSRPDADRALADALRRAGHRVILPGFRQVASPGSGSVEVIDSTPLPMFRERAQLGSVNLYPAPDGLVRRVPVSQEIAGQNHASLFALLAGPRYLDVGPFYLDYGIDPAAFTRLSYVEVLRGSFEDDLIAGKKVIVGSTAAELGDQFAVPVHHAQPGPILHALAYESLVQGRAIQRTAVFVTLIGAVVVAFGLGPYFARWAWSRGLIAVAIVLLGSQGTALAVQAGSPASLDTSPWFMVAFLGYSVCVIRSVEIQALQLFRQRIASTYRRALMHRVVEDSFDGIAITDSDGNIEVFNQAATTILGYPYAEVGGQSLERILPSVPEVFASAGISEDDADAATIPHIGPVEHTVAKRDGTEIVIEIVVSRSVLRRSRNPRERRTRDRVIYTYTFRDVSERRRLREAERAAAEEAVATNRAKSAFLANMSHELRTPLNAIIGFADIIRQEAFGPIEPPQYREYIGDIGDSGQHLLNVINDVLDVSRVETGQFELHEEDVDLSALLDSALRIIQGWPEAGERTIETEWSSGLPWVHADARLLKQSVINLMSNAVKYSEAGAHVVLRGYQGSDGAVCIEVEDSGIGIDEAEIANLTKPFYQVDSSLARRHEGSGLGLSLVAAYVDLHGGELHIRSRLGEGTLVRVSLPVERALNPTRAAAKSA